VLIYLDYVLGLKQFRGEERKKDKGVPQNRRKKKKQIHICT
jgi:hypothetical protein